ncbi:4-fold beta flower protein [Micrococcus luteus]|uniref:4-fold beta flower protein n=2 Tax=Micrococcus TaxID=1269 RepID=UPI00351B49CC
MEALFDRNGYTCAWMKDDTLFDLAGRVVAYIDQTQVFGRQGRHFGRLVEGNVRDHHGDVVAWTRKSHEGPLKPVAAIPPIPPLTEIVPIRPIFAIPPIPPINSLNWSRMTWPEFIAQ